MELEYRELLQDLIRCRPLSKDIDAVNRAHDVIKAFLDARSIYNVTEIIEGRKTLYAATLPEKVCDYLFNAHIDVVPATGEGQFEPYIEDDRLYGRGSGDDLGNVILMIELLCRNNSTGVSIGAVFTADEEIGGDTTAGMVERGYSAKKCAVVLDSWGGGGISIAQKGILSLKLTAHGHGGHSSTPWCSDNPIDKLLQGYMKFAADWKNPEAGDTWHDSMAATQINAGFAHNQIPDKAEMVVNFRCISEESMQTILKKVAEVTGFDVEIYEQCVPVVSDENAPELRRLLRLLGEERKIDPPCTRMNGATDARHLGSLGIPIAIMGLRSGGAHEAVEYLELSSYTPTLNALQRFVSGEVKP